MAGVFVTVGAFFLVHSIIGIGPLEISRMSETYLSRNRHVQSALVQQNIETKIGFTYTLVGGLLSVSESWLELTVSSGIATFAIIFLFVITAVSFSIYVSRRMQKSVGIKTAAISYSKHVKAYLKYERIDAQKLFSDIRKFGLDDISSDTSDSYEGIAEILRFADASVGAEQVLGLKAKAQKDE